MRIFGFEVLKIPFVFFVAQRKKYAQSKAPSGRELSPKATEGESTASVFLSLSVLKEGSLSVIGCCVKKLCRKALTLKTYPFGFKDFENPDSALVFSAIQQL